ncbi:MAG: TQO small subunit DoxD [Acidimicrobiales bacterium]
MSDVIDRGSPAEGRWAAFEPVEPVGGSVSRGAIAGFRILFGLLWLQGVGWKSPAVPFDQSSGFFYDFVKGAVSNEVFAPYAWLVDTLVLPNWTMFAWATWITEILLATFLVLGLATRFWALVGAALSAGILLSVANTPDEWGWAYWMMIGGHLVVFATAAGRVGGLDGVARPGWRRSRHWLARALVRAS